VLVAEDAAEARRQGRDALERHVRQSLNSRALDGGAPLRPEFRAMAPEHGGGVDVDEFIRQGRVLIGTPDECVALAERIHEEVGIDCINCTFSWGGIEESAVERSMRLFATEVIPRARGAAVSR
jgi:alkanesulfonate monooxygenase SsuD/methylene tetrahydromethanopterin reductase-like flavin-dependent oxidoreductase (luciferase family)